jgi:hypothetical protein
MRTLLGSVVFAGLLGVFSLQAADVPATKPAGEVTFNRDVLPILQEHCQTCHRPGEVGPMALVTYDGTRPWAKAWKAAVLARRCLRGWQDI